MLKKRLSDLGLKAQRGGDPQIMGLAVDSRLVQAGSLFAALPGTRVHGAEFISYALRMQAAAVLTDAAGAALAGDVLADTSAALIVVQDPRAALSGAAALWFGAQPETMVAVTGTNGKTSVASFTRQIWEALGYQATNIGTTGVEGGFSAPGIHTTPEPITLHRILAEMAAADVDHAAMEASSHGLDQRRLDAVNLAAAAFTNFSQDHLDYHKTFDAYFAAKARLFTELLPSGRVAVINLDDAKGLELAQMAQAYGHELLGVGHADSARLQLLGQRFIATGQELLFRWQGAEHQVLLDLIGGFQASNVLVAAGLAIGAGEDPEAVFDVLPKLKTVRGRMEKAAVKANGAAVFVDYAHTPDAIATALQALRPHVMGRIVAIIGAGGDRDRGKRPLMGQAAANHADHVIVTDDNPRTEEAARIRAEVLVGAPAAQEVGDRAEAILRGVDALGPGDALLIMGKGHETGQTVGDTVYPFDDAEQASISVEILRAGDRT